MQPTLFDDVAPTRKKTPKPRQTSNEAPKAETPRFASLPKTDRRITLQGKDKPEVPATYWVDYVKCLYAQLDEGEVYEEAGEDLAFEMAVVLGFYPAWMFAKHIGDIADHALYTDDSFTAFWVDDRWGSPKPTRAQIDLYAHLGWRQTALLRAWFERDENNRLIRDWPAEDANRP